MIFATVTIAINSPEPTLFCVITLFVWLSSLYDQDVPTLEFFVFVIVVIAAFIVVANRFSVRDGLVLIPLGTIICLAGGTSGRGWSVLGATFYYFLSLSSSLRS